MKKEVRYQAEGRAPGQTGNVRTTCTGKTNTRRGAPCVSLPFIFLAPEPLHGVTFIIEFRMAEPGAKGRIDDDMSGCR